MPIDPRRRDDIVAAVAVYDSANPCAPLPRNTARLLAVMFGSNDVCQRSLEDIAAEGFARNRLSALLRRLVETGLLSLERNAARAPNTYRLHLPPGAAMRCRRREKVFGPGRAVPLDRNAKARIAVYARAWSARNKQPRQHRGPITRAFLEVLEALLWGFHNSRSGCCFPSYEAIAAKAECGRTTVYEALKALEWAGVLTWQNRITRIRERCQDLFGADGWRWRVIRTSNAYVFRDPQAAVSGVPASKFRNGGGTLDQEVYGSIQAPTRDPNNPLERALARFGAALGAKDGIEQGSGTAGAT